MLDAVERVTNAPPKPARPPGILVVPFEHRHEAVAAAAIGLADALSQQVIVRMSAVQPVRVLSWTTSRHIRGATEGLDQIGERLHVRYLVEGVIDCDDSTTYVDVRVVDVERDQIMLADRFRIDGALSTSMQQQVAESVALHFALIHEGALVEPLCLNSVSPAGFLAYLTGARWFFEDPGCGDGRTLRALDRALQLDRDLVPALAMRALAALAALAASSRLFTDADAEVVNESRRIAATCAADTSCRVTVAFLGVALTRYDDGSTPGAADGRPPMLRWNPPSIALQGRLYDRRSPLKPRDAARQDAKQVASIADQGGCNDATRSRGGNRLFRELLHALVTSSLGGSSAYASLGSSENLPGWPVGGQGQAGHA